jgi:hypothetical protein
MVTGIKLKRKEGEHGMVGLIWSFLILSTQWKDNIYYMGPGLNFPVKADNLEIVEGETPPLRSPHSISTYKYMTWFKK